MRHLSRYRLLTFFVIIFAAANLLLLGTILWRRHQQARANRALLAAQLRIKDIALAALLYSEQYDGCLPLAETWQQTLPRYMSASSTDTNADSDQRPYKIAFNRLLAGRKVEEITPPSAAILFFESTAIGADGTADVASIPISDSTGMFAVVFADGHGYPRTISSRDGLIRESLSATQH